jgi:hypothetical protein
MTNDLRSLILKRDPVGQNPEHYSVLEDGVVIGRIFKVPVAPPDRPWMWASGHSAATVKRAAHGYEPTREAAMGAFAKSWRAWARARTHKSSRHFRFRANQTSSRRRRMTESDPTRTSAAERRVIVLVPPFGE